MLNLRTQFAVVPGSCNIIDGYTTAIKTHGASFNDMILLHPASLKMALGMNPKAYYKRTRMGLAADVRQLFEEARVYTERWNAYERGDRDNPPDIIQRLEPIRDLLQHRIPAHIHCARADDILFAVELAEEYNFDISLAHVYEGYKIAEILGNKKIPVVAGPFLSGWDQGKSGPVPVNNAGIMVAAGVPLAITTDNVNPGELMFHAAFTIRLGLSEEDALKGITITAARIGGIEERVGSIERGKDADIVVLNGAPFHPGSSIVSVLVNGVVVFDDYHESK